MLALSDNELDIEDGEDLELEYSFGNSRSHLEVPGFNVVTSADQEVPQYADLESSLLRPPTTPKQVAELKNFKDKISSLLRSTSSAAMNASSTLNKSKQVREEEFFKFLAHLN